MILVPYDATEPKTRLAPVLGPGERGAFAAAMLRDVLGAVNNADHGHEIRVLATEPIDSALAGVHVDVNVDVDDPSKVSSRKWCTFSPMPASRWRF